MSTRPTISRLAASFRQLAGMFSVLFLLTGLLPSHAGARIGVGERGAIDMVSLQFGDQSQSNMLDGAPNHVAGQCSCSSTVLPDVISQPSSLLIRPVEFAMGAIPFLPFAAQAPPSKPPRT
jgi:hypothetical protein